MIEEILREIGLSSYETKVYLALLDNGESTASEILDHADIQTGKIYEILNSLKNKGMVSIIIKNKTKHFSAADPRRVLKYIENKEKTIARQKENFSSILPQMLAKIDQIKENTHIEVYTGFEGIKNAYEKETALFNKKSTLYDIGILQSSSYDKKIFDYFTYNVRPRRERAKIKIKKIIGEGADKKYHEPSAKIRFLPFGSPVTITVLENLTIIGIFSEVAIALTIESTTVAKSFIDQFKILWDIAKEN